jgi:hypothetical protein
MTMWKRDARTKTLALLFSTSLMSILLNGCRDFSNVKELGDSWKVIDQTSTIIANDFYQSCLRSSKHPASARLFGLTDYFNAVKLEKEKCEKRYLPARNNIIGTYAVYSEYLRKLSILADKNTGAVTNDQKDELESAIGNLFGQLQSTGVKVPEILSNNINAGVNLVSIIFGFIGNDIRRNAIEPTIICTNEDIQKYTDGLMQISNVVYINQLTIERGAFESHITNFTPLTDRKLTINETRNLFDMENYLVGKDNDLDEREMVARSFSDVLKATATTHSSLSAIFVKELKLTDDLKKKTYCEKYEKRILENAKKSQEISISPKTLTEISNVLTNYQKNIKPSIDSITASKIYRETIH